MKSFLFAILVIAALLLPFTSAALTGAAAIATAHPMSIRLATAFRRVENSNTKNKQEHPSHTELVTRKNRRKIVWIARK